MDPVVFVKLGGSLITDKTRPFTVRGEAIERLAREVADSRDAHGGRLVVGHGSGSFGHVAADRTGLLDCSSNGDRAEALSRTQQAAAALHRHVTEALRGAGVPVFSFAPSSAFVASEGMPVDVHGAPVRHALEEGTVPVTYGDVVLDRERGATICSTETVFRVLIRELEDQGVSTSRVLWMGDTDGVYDADGATIETLSPDAAAQLLETLDTPTSTDVTGGIRLRVRTAGALARRGIPSLITNGLEAGRLRRALCGTSVPGTEVVPEGQSSAHRP